MVNIIVDYKPDWFESFDDLGRPEQTRTIAFGNLQIIARESQYQFVDKDPQSVNFCVNRVEVKRIEAWIE